MRLKDKKAIVTGAGRGIGREIAVRLASEGASVVVADIDPCTSAVVADEIRAIGGCATAFPVDIGDERQVGAMVAEAVSLFGRLDILVNNAGIGHVKPFLGILPDEWNEVIRINLTGTFFCSQAAARHMVENRSGKIINIASISGERGGVGRAAYGAAKAGVILMTKVMAVELAQKGVHVNCVSPGPVHTLQSEQFHDALTREAYLHSIPSHRYGEAREIADAVIFLASKESSWVHGHVLHVDGGFSAAGLMFGDEASHHL